MPRRWLILALFLAASAAVLADEGMWLFNAPPTEKLKAKYGFQSSPEWLEHVRLSSVRFNNGGSGSFVSSGGLTFTNHHVGAECLHQLSTAEKDYLKLGFYARSREEEAKCPDLELNVLQRIEEVTDRVNGAVKPGISTAEAGQAQRAAMADIEKDCATRTGLRCDVVTLYSGGKYHLYQYKKYTDVRLVFAPEYPAAFFGGDPDNFEFPRYDLDIAFFRIYENGKPAQLQHFLKWSQAGVKDGELVFVSGHPGGTDRQNTVAQLEVLRDVYYPFRLRSLRRRIAMLKDFSAQAAENARVAQEDIFSLENAQKAFKGELEGLLEESTLEKRAGEEKKLRAAVEASPKLKNDVGDAWQALAQGARVEREIFLPYRYLERRDGYSGDLALIARLLVRATEEKQKPNGERLREYRDSNLASLEQQLFSPAPVYKNLQTAWLSESLAEMRDELGASDPAVQAALQGKSPAEAAREAVSGTTVDKVEVRRQLYDGGAAAVAAGANNDPLIALVRRLDPYARRVRKRYEDEVETVERLEGAKLAQARFATEGTGTPPDATFTLRLSYGAVRGYVEDGRGIVPKGTRVSYFTTMGGAYQHASAHGNRDPYQLPESWTKQKPAVKLSTPLNFVHTADIIGGNSGSPTVNRAGQVVGIIFDGNIQSLPWDYVYDDVLGRAVSVDARGILEALRHIYHADGLVQELNRGSF